MFMRMSLRRRMLVREIKTFCLRLLDGDDEIIAADYFYVNITNAPWIWYLTNSNGKQITYA